jgi:hypothetical protein
VSYNAPPLHSHILAALHDSRCQHSGQKLRSSPVPSENESARTRQVRIRTCRYPGCTRCSWLSAGR